MFSSTLFSRSNPNFCFVTVCFTDLQLFLLLLFVPFDNSRFFNYNLMISKTKLFTLLVV